MTDNHDDSHKLSLEELLSNWDDSNEPWAKKDAGTFSAKREQCIYEAFDGKVAPRRVAFEDEMADFHAKHATLHSGKALPYLTVGSAIRADNNTIDAMEKGAFKPMETLDLHGLTQDQAFDLLKDFIVFHYAKGKRRLRVITGRGDNPGVLQQMVPRWLNSGAMTHMIRAFAHPPRKEGGEGALLVMLVKK